VSSGRHPRGPCHVRKGRVQVKKARSSPRGALGRTEEIPQRQRRRLLPLVSPSGVVALPNTQAQGQSPTSVGIVGQPAYARHHVGRNRGRRCREAVWRTRRRPGGPPVVFTHGLSQQAGDSLETAISGIAPMDLIDGLSCPAHPPRQWRDSQTGRMKRARQSSSRRRLSRHVGSTGR